MKRVRLIILLFVIIHLMTRSVFGYKTSQCIDAEQLLTEYFRILESDNPEEMNRWASSKSEPELAVIPIVVGNGLLNQIEGNALTDSAHYNAYMSAIGLIEKGVDAIDKSGFNEYLYVTTAEAGMVPVRYILANAYDKVYKYMEADSAYTQTAREIGRDFGQNSEEFVFWSNQCAESLQRKNKNYEKAISLLLPVKEAALHSPEVSDSTACEYLISLAQKYQRSGNHKEAKHLAHEAEKRMGKNQRLIFCVSNTLGELYWIEGNHDTGYSYFKKAEANAPSLDEFFAAGVNCANILRQTGFIELAKTTFLELEKYLTSSELSIEAVFNYYESLGVLYIFTDPVKSADYFRKAETYIDYVDYPSLIRHIINSQIYPNEGNSFKVISALERAESLYGLLIFNAPNLVNELLMLKGYYLMEIKDYKLARKYLEKAYMHMSDYAPGDSQMLTLLRYLAQLDEIEGDEIRRGYYLGAQLRNAKLHGETSGAYLNAVADNLHYNLQEGHLEQANYFYDIYRKNRPTDFNTRCFGYRLKKLENKISEAEKDLFDIRRDFPDEKNLIDFMFQKFYLEQHSSKITNVAHDVFSVFTEETSRKLLFMSNRERRNYDLEIRLRRDEIISSLQFAPELVGLALDYSLFSKGLLFHTQSKINNILLKEDSARIEIDKIRGLKAELMFAAGSLDSERVNSIRRAIDSRERYVISDFIHYDIFKNDLKRYCKESLFSHISSNETMLDFVEYENMGESNIGCFIIGGNGNLRFQGLGKSETLTQENIYKVIWNNIIPFISEDMTIYFSTDGDLNVLPIEYAEDENGVPMCEKYSIHRVFHLSDVDRSSHGLGNSIVAVGVSDHNSPIGCGENINRGDWIDLPNVEYEMQLINNALQGYDVRILLNDEATEPNILALSGTPISTLHISTHGFYRSSADLNEAINNPSSDDYHIARRFLSAGVSEVSGFILRQGNISWKSPRIFEEHDDILTSDEIEIMSFPNLNLAVLSACETGLGEIDSDGVWGLQRAFRIAGAKSLICSLAKVNDYWTAQFMDVFYEQAAQGNNIYDSFQSAQRWLRHELPDNPEIWSSFILIE